MQLAKIKKLAGFRFWLSMMGKGEGETIVNWYTSIDTAVYCMLKNQFYSCFKVSQRKQTTLLLVLLSTLCK